MSAWAAERSTSGAVENLIRSGAFDSTGARRSQLIQVYESIMDAVAASRRQNLEGQLDFFSMAMGQESVPVKEIPPAGYSRV